MFIFRIKLVFSELCFSGLDKLSLNVFEGKRFFFRLFLLGDKLMDIVKFIGDKKIKIGCLLFFSIFKKNKGVDIFL